MRRLWIYTWLAAALFSACQDDSFYYSGEDKICFRQEELYFSFGEEPFAVQDTLLSVPVEIIGYPKDRERHYEITVDAEHTTALEHKHYELPSTAYTLSAGQSYDSIYIQVKRLNLQDDSVYHVTVNLLDGKDFLVDVIKSVTVNFTNRLDCPDWWNILSTWLGEYDKRKYQKFIEIYGKAVTKEEVIDNKYAFLRIFKEVKAYFEANPQYEVTFPDVDWIV